MFALILATLMVPFQALLTPLFLEMHSLGLTNSLIGLALFYTTFNLPFGVFVMRNTFLQIPWELSEQASVDGASAARTLVSVLRPLVVPGIATTILYAFLFPWTEFVGALVFLTSNDLYTVPLALLNMEYGSVGQVNFGYWEAAAAWPWCVPVQHGDLGLSGDLGGLVGVDQRPAVSADGVAGGGSGR